MSDSQFNQSLPSNPNPEGDLSGDGATVFMREAYERVADELAAIPDDELVRPNVDVPVAVGIVLDRLPALRSLRAEWLEKLPHVDISRLDRLQDYALALAFTHACIRIVGEAQSELPEVYESALAQRDALLAAAKGLSAFGQLEESRFERVGLERGYRNVAYDLSSLAEMFRREWPRIGSRCPFDFAQVQAAESCANAMLYGSVDRARVSGDTAPHLKDRQRAFTALNRAYDDVRRAVGFLRWREEDENTFAPGLVPGGRGTARRSAKREAEEGEPEASTPAVPATRASASEQPDDEDTHGRESLFAAPSEI